MQFVRYPDRKLDSFPVANENAANAAVFQAVPLPDQIGQQLAAIGTQQAERLHGDE